MRLRLLAVLLVLVPAIAHADILSVTAEAHGGGGAGLGIGGDRKDQAFFKGARGGVYGGKLDVEILFIDVWLQHHQYNDGKLDGTWTQFMAGLDLDRPIGEQPKPVGAKKKPRAKGYFEVGVGVGFGVGTGRQVVLPLDNAQVTDKGFLIEGKIGAGANLGPVIQLGLEMPISAGYFFKSGPGVIANDLSTHYQSVEGALLLNLRFIIKAK